MPSAQPDPVGLHLVLYSSNSKLTHAITFNKNTTMGIAPAVILAGIEEPAAGAIAAILDDPEFNVVSFEDIP